MGHGVAVFDVGKTNVKLIVFDREGNVLAERSQPNGSLPPDARWPYLRLDTERAWAFLLAALKDIGRAVPIAALSISAHGAAGALVTEDGLAAPPVDYEFDGFDGIDADYDAIRPSFEECLSPRLPRGLNLGRQIFFVERACPRAFASARAFLAYPQYWSWRLSGVMATEATALGAHTDLWRPNEGRLSSLVERAGWSGLFPPPRKAWETLGPLTAEVAAATGLPAGVRVICGAHDSNASLVPHLAARTDPFTVVSTGTWVIIMAVGGTGKLDPRADMLANVDVLGRPAPTARLMGGREFAAIAGERPAEAREPDVAAIVAAGILAMPSFSDQGGPFAGRKGWIEGAEPATPAARAALATLYCALMTAHALERLDAPGDIIVEGGFNRTPAFSGLLAALTPGRTVLVAPASGAAEGAAMLALWGEPHAPPKCARATPWDVPGLAGYAERWRRGLSRSAPA
ncbi:sugar (pentulose or hexulose) kinase [Roseiarcus fermentans]|uniref:Sugar (Pentulose or hexulose) kinase n=1 Tax=Roseiarcus fermentans TaxID=1473586 RepID=A0A366FJ55_9HYPH|nr:sugar kinase [Roseiarcus fermentans]RBP13749.1 sugar (pentulose or hexulose) kinase [Roseiarcus fermentans]